MIQSPGSLTPASPSDQHGLAARRPGFDRRVVRRVLNVISLGRRGGDEVLTSFQLVPLELVNVYLRCRIMFITDERSGQLPHQ